jgi:hypothetical protein
MINVQTFWRNKSYARDVVIVGWSQLVSCTILAIMQSAALILMVWAHEAGRSVMSYSDVADALYEKAVSVGMASVVMLVVGAVGATGMIRKKNWGRKLCLGWAALFVIQPALELIFFSNTTLVHLMFMVLGCLLIIFLFSPQIRAVFQQPSESQ